MIRECESDEGTQAMQNSSENKRAGKQQSFKLFILAEFEKHKIKVARLKKLQRSEGWLNTDALVDS